MTEQIQFNKIGYAMISKLCDFRKGKKVNSSKIKTEKSVSYLLIDTLRGAEPEFFTEDKNYIEAIPEDILIVADGANSGLVGTGVKGAVGSTILRIRIKVKDLNKDYLSYFLKSKFEEFNKDMKGTGIPHLKPKKMIESEIRKPPIEEQVQIVSEIEKQFTRLDEAVKSLKLVKGKLEVYKKAVLSKSFSEYKNHGNFIDFVEILDSKRVPVNSDEREKRKGEVPYYGATGQVGWIDDYLFNEELVLLGEDGAPFLDLYKSKAYIINGKSWVNNHAHVLKGKNGLKNKALLYWLNIINYRDYVMGTTRLKLNQTRMKNIPIPLMSEIEQEKIISLIESKFSIIDKIEQVVELSLLKAEKLRKSILKSAFEGKLVKMEEVKNEVFRAI